MRCAARSSKPIRACSRRTQSANGPPPGTTTARPPPLSNAADDIAEARGCRAKLPPTLTTVGFNALRVRRPSSMASTGFSCRGSRSGRSMVSSTPTPPGPISSFSTFTVTRRARGSRSTSVAIRSASVSTKSMCSSATMRGNGVGDEVVGEDLPHALRLAARRGGRPRTHRSALFAARRARGCRRRSGPAARDRARRCAPSATGRPSRDDSRAPKAAGSRHCRRLPGARAG